MCIMNKDDFNELVMDGEYGICIECCELVKKVKLEANEYACPSCGCKECVVDLGDAFLCDKVELYE